jgi:hypothetical protein
MKGGDRELSGTAGLWMKEEKECIALLSRNIKCFRSRLGLSQIELALLTKTLKVEVYQIFKPDAEFEDGVHQAVSRYINDVDEAVIRAVEVAVRPAVENVTRQMREFYGD